MSVRLLVVAHGRAGSAGDPVFGDPGPLVGGAEVAPVPGRVEAWVIGPEPACGQTATVLGAEAPDVEPNLAGPDPGVWAGRGLGVVLADDPAALQAWTTNSSFAPPGGESIADAMTRVGAVLDTRDWRDGRTAVVVSPVVARLLALHAIGASADAALRLDVRFGARFELSRAGRSWRLLLG